VGVCPEPFGRDGELVSFRDRDSAAQKGSVFGFEPEGCRNRLDIPRELSVPGNGEAGPVRATRCGLLLTLVLVRASFWHAQFPEVQTEPDAERFFLRWDGSKNSSDGAREQGREAIHPDGGGVAQQPSLLVVTGETVPNAVPASVPSYRDPPRAPWSSGASDSTRVGSSVWKRKPARVQSRMTE
jgi:hypothetical protein